MVFLYITSLSSRLAALFHLEKRDELAVKSTHAGAQWLGSNFVSAATYVVV